MSIYTAMRAGVSGLTANSSAMAAISDNIANINTVAYKRGTASFSALVNDQGGSTTYNAGGVGASVRRVVDLQGSLEQSSAPTDLAISGPGFFVVSRTTDPVSLTGGVMFSRAGSFRVDSEGFLANTQNLYLQGWPVQSDGSVVSSPTSLAAIEPINVLGVSGNAQATGNVAVNANLPSSEPVHVPGTGVPAVPPAYSVGTLATGTIQPHHETTFEVYDSLGASRTLAIGFLKTAANVWAVEVYARPAVDAPANPGGRVAEGTVTFDTNGNLSATTGTLATFTIPWAPTSSQVASSVINLDMTSGLTQFATTFGVNSITADGVPPGTLTGLRLEGDGMLMAQFSNGRSRALYQIPVATFLNPNGLRASQDGAYNVTLDSGIYSINAANSGGAGRIQSGVLEASNVDLAQEFTQLITTQRAYSASSRIITTADEMLEELLRIKR
jgi:flagellar hook protein FlgE